MSDRRQQDTEEHERWNVDKCIDKLLIDAQRSSALRQILDDERIASGQYELELKQTER